MGEFLPMHFANLMKNYFLTNKSVMEELYFSEMGPPLVEMFQNMR
jgi:hypothetical protein